jgi:hypothetical protein
MTQDMKSAPSKTAPSNDAKEQALYFNTMTLSRFMRACYGADAAKEAQRHVTAYTETNEPEIAEIWKRVVAHILGVEIKEDPRRVVKANKPLRLLNE